MPVQGIQKLSSRRVVETGENRVECVELVKILMPADRWPSATVAGAFPVIEALYRSSWQATLCRDLIRIESSLARPVWEARRG